MNVGLLIPTPQKPCGVHEYTRDLAQALLQTGVQPHMLAGPHWQLAQRLEHLNAIDVLHIQFGYYLYPVEFLRRVAEIAARRRWGLAATVHGFRPDRTAFHEILQPYPVIVHSERMQNALAGRGFRKDRVFAAPMPCPPVTHPVPVDPFRVGFFGFLLPHKGLIELCDALKRLTADFPSLSATILSASAPFDVSAAYRTAVSAALSCPELTGRVKWNTGFMLREDVLNALARCRVIVLPYREHTEVGVSAAARVAVASGRPVITTGASFFDGLEADALRVARNDAESLTAAVKSLFDSPDLCDDYAGRSVAHARRNSWRRAAEAHLPLYRCAFQSKDFW